MRNDDVYEDGAYRADEIKSNIDAAILKSMFENDEGKWNTILEVQSRLYEEFGISDRNLKFK